MLWARTVLVSKLIPIQYLHPTSNYAFRPYEGAEELECLVVSANGICRASSKLVVKIVDEMYNSKHLFHGLFALV